MRKTLLTLTLLVIIYSFASANTYYVAVNGSDSDAGTIGSPWGTWQKAFNTAVAGDTVYFRGGIWQPTQTAFQANITYIDPNNFAGGGNRGHSGKPGALIYYLNYPGEKPVLDCSYIEASGNYIGALSLWNTHYLYFRGLEIKSVYQEIKGRQAQGISTWICSNMTFENMVIDSIAGQGMWVTSSVGYFGTMKDSIGNQYNCSEYSCVDTVFAIPTDTTRIINCDIFDCVDSLSWNPYNYADGIKGDLSKGGVMYLSGVRVWNTCDDGIDLSGPGQKILNNCWVFNVGSTIPVMLQNQIDDGNGFKLGGVRDSIKVPNWIMSNCISAGNFRYAIHMLDYNPYYRNNARVFNSVFYKNERGPAAMNNSLRPWQNTEFYNCISYSNIEREVAMFGYPYPIHNCSWIYSESSAHPYDPNPLVSVTDADFISVDINELSKPRKADFSLPDVDFMKLAPNSDLIDAGINVGLPYNGNAPDIGAFESGNSSGLPKTSTNNLRFTISPTLVEEEAFFQFTGIHSGVFHFEIYNLSGLKVLETEPAQIAQGANRMQINLNSFKHGLYLCRLICNEQITSTLKFVKK